MQKWKEDFLSLWKNKWYRYVLILTAVCSYGFLITHQTVGIDDTPYAYYFEEGLVAIVGRWVLFLLNKLLRISEFSPFMMDLVGLILLFAAVMVWSTLLYSVLKDRLPMWGYLFFAGIFMSSPIISEVFTYYLHNGVAIGYLASGIGLCCFSEGLKGLESKKGYLSPFIGAVLFLWVSIGCYESFMIVWLVGVLLLLLTERYADIKRNVFISLVIAAGITVVGILLRSLMIVVVTKIFGLESMRDEAVQRSMTEMLGWMFESDAGAVFNMTLKRVFVMYGVFAYAYLPITVFVFAMAVMFLYGIYKAVRNRDGWIFLLTLGTFIAAFLLVVIEGKVTLYRAAQFLPVICGYGVLLGIYAVRNISVWLKEQKFAVMKRISGWINGLAMASCAILLFNQCSDMNRWFYVDYLKYEDAKNVMNQVMHELEKNYDLSKQVVFTGAYEPPKSILGDAYVDYNSDTFFAMKRITDMVDEHLLEKFYRNQGVWVAQTPALSVIDWGRSAFESNAELVRFLAMHGHVIPVSDPALFESAELYAMSLPSFPKEGSIVDMGEYIIVHF